MTSFLTTFLSKKTPNQQALNDKKIAVEVLQTQVVQRELDLATLRSELQSFKTKYYQRVGGLYRVRDTLNAEIATLLLALEPDNEDYITAAEEATAQAKATDEEINEEIDEDANEAIFPEEAAPFKPTAELKNAYRKAAMLTHPDRAVSDEDRAYRTEIMAAINVAYESMDLETIAELVSQFHTESNIGDGAERQLALLIRQETALKNRLTVIDIEITIHQNNGLAQFKVYCDTEAENSNDPITTIASDLRTDIDSLKLRVVELQHMLTEHEAQQQAAVIAKQPPIHAQSHTKNSHTGHIHHTDRGEFVRSKSELVIANLLHSLELQYHYEYTIEGCNTGGTMLPDFVFISRNNEIFVWEHLGMLTIPKYRERWSVKRDWYEDNDFVQGINFFVSRDASDGSLDSQMIRKIAMLVKTLL